MSDPTGTDLPEPRPEGDAVVAAPEPPKPRRSTGQVLLSIARGVKNVFIRMYALALVVVLAWTGYVAFMSLVKTVFVPQPVPQRFLEWQGNIDAAALRSGDVAGLTGAASRAPLAHYHRLDRWFQADPQNGCAALGCHEPLPHTKEAKIPAFANFHATFLSCQMCHADGAVATAPAVWVSTIDGRRMDKPPALLRLVRYMETSEEQIRTEPQVAHGTITLFLRQAMEAAGQDPQLADLLIQFDTSEPGSPVWKRAVERLERELPQHARGEYGAKIAREQSPGQHRETSRQMLALSRLGADDTRRRQVHQSAPGLLRKEAVTCVSCHSQSAALDFESLGYSPRRVKFLSNLQLASLMQRIREGERFFIPKLLGGGNGSGQ